MLVYFDTKDLINILEKSDPVPTSELDVILRGSGSKLVLSFTTINELAAPLRAPNSKTNVMKLLSGLEALPHVFVLAGGDIEGLELKEALAAFTGGREYTPIDPMRPRLDSTFSTSESFSTGLYMHFPLAEVVWEFWHEDPEVLGGYARHHPHYEALLEADREINNPPQLAEYFPVVVQRSLTRLDLGPINLNLTDFGNWIYSTNSRCPAMQLCFEAYHKLRRNRTDMPKSSDLGDLAHLYSLPYVNVATLDRRMLDYVNQVFATWKGRMPKCFQTANEVLELLGSEERKT